MHATGFSRVGTARLCQHRHQRRSRGTSTESPSSRLSIGRTAASSRQKKTFLGALPLVFAPVRSRLSFSSFYGARRSRAGTVILAGRGLSHVDTGRRRGGKKKGDGRRARDGARKEAAHVKRRPSLPSVRARPGPAGHFLCFALHCIGSFTFLSPCRRVPLALCSGWHPSLGHER